MTPEITKMPVGRYLHKLLKQLMKDAFLGELLILLVMFMSAFASVIRRKLGLAKRGLSVRTRS